MFCQTQTVRPETVAGWGSEDVVDRKDWTHGTLGPAEKCEGQWLCHVTLGKNEFRRNL